MCACKKLRTRAPYLRQKTSAAPQRHHGFAPRCLTQASRRDPWRGAEGWQQDPRHRLFYIIQCRVHLVASRILDDGDRLQTPTLRRGFRRQAVADPDAPAARSGQPLATVSAVMTNQDGEVMATGRAEILLPSP